MKIFKSPVLTLLVLLVAAAPARAAGYIDPQQQTSLAFGQRSFWVQPWRGYLDTVPGTVMRDAVGVNSTVDPAETPRTAEVLARAGVRRARVEIPWSAMSFDDPARLADLARIDAVLTALRANGIRPLILLNANQGAPGPPPPPQRPRPRPRGRRRPDPPPGRREPRRRRAVAHGPQRPRRV